MILFLIFNMTMMLQLQLKASQSLITKSYNYPADKVLTNAVENNRIPYLRNWLTKNPNLNTTIESRTLFIEAARYGYFEMAQLFINAGFDIHALDENNCNALMHAAFNGHETIVKLLLQHEAQVNAVSKNLQTALMMASVRGHKEIVTILIDAEADLNAEDNKDQSAMNLAIERKQPIIVSLLLTAGSHKHFMKKPCYGTFCFKFIRKSKQ